MFKKYNILKLIYQMLRKLLMIILGIFLVLAAGSCNIYPLYLKQMKDKFGFSLKQANLYGSFINLGLWVAFTMGMFYDKFGPKRSCILGAALLSGSYALLHSIMNSDLTSIGILPMLLIAFVMGQGSALCYTTAVTTNLKNFSANSSAIVGLLVSNMALSPSLFTIYREALPNVRMAEYFLIISVFLAIVILICGCVFTTIKNLYSEHEKMKGYEKYKEKRIIRLLVIVNIGILVIYIFGVIFNNIESENRFPNAIIYPSLQLVNLVFIFMEKFGGWEKIYFLEFIEKKMRKKILLDEIKFRETYKLREDSNLNNNLSNEVSNIPHGSIEIENQVAKVNADAEVVNLNIEKETPFGDGICANNASSNAQDLDNNSKRKRKSSFDLDKKSNKIELCDLKTDLPPQTHNHTYIENSNQKIQSLFNFEEGKSITGKSLELIKMKPEEIVEVVNSGELNLNNIDINNQNQNPKDIIRQSLPAVEINLEGNNSEFKKFLVLISTKEVLLLFIILILGVGSAISNLNNIQFIITSVKGNPTSKEIYEYAILYFAFNSFTRIISGLIIDKLIEKQKTFYFLVGVSLIGMVSQILGRSMDQEWLFFSVSLAGATHGGYMTFTPIYTQQFGLDNMGKVLGFLTTGCAIGSILISGFTFTLFYDQYTVDDKCIGKMCFSDAYIMNTFFFLVNIGLSLYLLILNKRKLQAQSEIQENALKNNFQ